MATTIKTLVEGSTERELFQLREIPADGSAVADTDGTGLTVADVLLTSVDGQPVDTSGKFGWSTQASGIAYFDPAANDLKAQKSPYRVRFKLTDASAKIRFYPSHGTAEIKVLAQRA